MPVTLDNVVATCEILYMLEKGEQNREKIANELRISRTYVNKIANKYGYGKVKNVRNKYHWTKEDAYNIRVLHMQGVSKMTIARQFNIPQRYVEYIMYDWVFPTALPEGWERKPSKHPEEVIEGIRNEPDEIKHDAVAEKYGVNLTMVKVIRNKNWR